jgi:hypothetical protein
MAGRDTGAAQKRVSEQRRILEKYPPFPPTLKALLAGLHGQPRWPVRPPLLDAPAGVEEQAARELAQVA